MTVGRNFRKWIAELRTTDKTQCKGQLHVEGDGYCCLGIGYAMLPNHSPEELRHRRLAPPAFLRWLGFEHVSGLDEDVQIDWLDNFETQGKRGIIEGSPEELDVGVPYSKDMGGAAELNDEGFTFAQIADVLNYFGVKERGTP